MTRARLIALAALAVGAGALGTPASALAAFDSTATSVSCAPASVTTGTATTCTATVTDTPNPALTPFGTVNFSASPGGSSFASCSLDASGTCSVAFTPAAGGDPEISAAYAGSGSAYQPSTGSTTITAVDPTATSMSCDATTVSINSSTVCTASLTDPYGGQTPVGQVTFTSVPGSGNFGAASCHPGPQNSGSATCRVTFTPLSPGGYTLNAGYGGDTHHAASSGSARLNATTTPAGGGPGSHGGGSSGTLTIPVSSGPPPPGTLTIRRKAKVSRKRVAMLFVSCTAQAGGVCSGPLFVTRQIKVRVATLTRRGNRLHRGVRTATRTILVGSVNYQLGPGGSRTLKLKLSKAALRALARSRTGALRVTATPFGQAPVTITLKPAKSKPRKRHRKQ